MTLFLIAYSILVFAPVLGYAVYRARQIAIIERMGRQLYLETMPLASDNPLLNRPSNPDLDIIYSKSGAMWNLALMQNCARPGMVTMQEAGERLALLHGKPPTAYTYAQSLRGAPVGRYVPDTDTWVPAPYVKDEFEERAGEMLQVEML